MNEAQHPVLSGDLSDARPVADPIRHRQLRSIVGGSIGNVIEWFDFQIYTTFSLYFAASFFPRENRTVQLLGAAAIFALGFILRPVGSWILGAYADRHGRRAGLTLSVSMMCVGSLGIAFCPTYATIGFAAPLLLLVARLVQGVSLGGEYGTSSVYLSEIAPPGRRGFYSSFQYVTLILGQLLATALQVLLQVVLLTHDQLVAWGWRIPFLLGAALALVAYWVRRTIDETPDYKKLTSADKQAVGFRELLQHRRALLLCFGITIGGTLAFFTYTVYMHAYLENTMGLSQQLAAWVSLATLTIFMLVQPLFGALADVVGRKALLVTFGVVGTLGSYPMLAGLAHTHSTGVAILLLGSALLIVTCYTSVSSVIKAELFPARVRTLGVSLPHSIATAMFGGTAGYVGLWFKSNGSETGFYYYTAACIACSMVAALCLRKSDSDRLP